MKYIKTSHGVVMLGVCFIIAIIFVNWASKQIDSLNILISPSTQVAQVAPTDGLVAYYTFDDNANDSVGSKNGTVFGGAGYMDGKVGRAMEFDGVDDYVTTSASLPTLGSFSFSFWMKNNGLTSGAVISRGNGHMACSRDGTSLKCTVDGNGTGAATAGNVFDGSWHHIVFTTTSNSQTIYKDGAQVGSTSETFIGTNQEVRFGNRLSSSSYFAGLVDDVRIYNRLLTSNEVGQLYALGSTGSLGGASESNIPAVVKESVPAQSEVSSTPLPSESETPATLPLIVPKSGGTGPNWYVDTDVSVSGDGSSWETAYKRFADIRWNLVKPGHTVWVSGGTYAESIVVGASGTRSSPIILKASQETGHNNRIILQGDIATWGQNYITFDGAKSDDVQITSTFDVKTRVPANINWQTQGFSFGTEGGGNGITIRWIEMGNHVRTAANRNSWGIYWNNNDQWNNIVEYSSFNMINDTGIKVGGNSPGNFDDVIVRWNYFYGIGNDNIEGQGGYTVHNNYFDQQHRWSIPAAGQGSHADGFAGPMGKTRFYNNIVIDVWDQIIYLKIWEGGGGNGHNDVYVYGNLIYIDQGALLPKDDGVQVAASFGWETGRPNVPLTNEWKNVVFANNTIIADGTKGPGKILNMIDLVNMYAPINGGGQSNTVLVRNMKVMNNIFYKSPTSGSSLKGGEGSGFSYTENDLVYDYNVVYSTVPAGRSIGYLGRTYTAETLNAATAYKNNTSEEPIFSNVSLHDYRLTSNDTAAKNKGADLSSLNLPGFDIDLAGNRRGQGNAWDIGALESSGSSNPTAGLVLHIPFNTDNFSTTNNDTYKTIPFTDASGTGNITNCQSAFALNGTTYNQCPTQSTGPDGSKAAQFTSPPKCDNAADYLAISRNTSINSLSRGSLALWINSGTNSEKEDYLFRVIGALKTGTKGTWQLHRDGDMFYTFTVNADNGAETDVLTFPGGSAPMGAWNHYAITWDGATIKGFYNGTYFGEFPMSGISSLDLSNYLAVGTLMHGDPRNSSDGGNCVNQYGGTPGQSYVFPNAGFFSGKVDDIRIYNKALSASEIASLVAIASTPSNQYILATTKAGSGTGSVSGGGIDCGKHCAESFASGANVTLTASADANSVFSGWSGDCTGTGSCVLNMNGHKTATATFTRTTSFVDPFPYEAEAGAITSPYVSVNGSIYQPAETLVPANGGRAAFTFSTTEAGDYLISAKVNAPSGGSNSMFINVDTEPSTSNIWHIKTTSGFENRFASWGTNNEGNNSPKTFSIPAGNHTLIICGREPGVYIDSVTIERIGVPGEVMTDTTPPTVSIVAPSNNATISGSAVNIRASAEDPTISGQTTSGISTVQFKANNIDITGGRFTTAPYTGTWDTRGVSNGSYTLTAVATDVAGNTTTSNSVTVNVSNAVNINNPPTSNAGNNQTVILPNTASLSGSGSDPDGTPALYSWSKVSGAGTVTFSNQSIPNPTATFSTPGTYTLRLIVSSDSLSAYDDVLVIVRNEVPSGSDEDEDGVPDSFDKCPDTPKSLTSLRNTFGCIPPKMDNFQTRTSLDNVDPDSLLSFEIGNTTYGKVVFNTSTPLRLFKTGSSRLDIDSNLTITKGNISLNSTNLPELAIPATVTLYNIDTLNPKILRDGVVCTECTIVSYQNNTLVFTVPGFSTFSIVNDTSSSSSEVVNKTGGRRRNVGIITPTVPQVSDDIFSRLLAYLSGSTSSPSPISLITKWLVLGIIDQQVKTLQIILNRTGYTVSTTGAGSPNQETSYFGPATLKSLQSFQCKVLGVCSGTPDSTGYGATGPKTRSALNEKAGTIQTTQPTVITPSSTKYTFTRSLTIGDEGEDVRQLQIFLNNKGFIIATTGPGSPGNESTSFGNLTRDALARFQEAHASEILTPNGLTKGTGFFGEATRGVVNRD